MKSRQKRISHYLIILVFLLSAPLAVLAFGGGPRGGGNSDQGGPGRRPPAEAFEACANKAESDSCTMKTPRGDMSGTCNSIEGDLVCAPDDFQSGRNSRR